MPQNTKNKKAVAPKDKKQTKAKAQRNSLKRPVRQNRIMKNMSKKTVNEKFQIKRNLKKAMGQNIEQSIAAKVNSSAGKPLSLVTTEKKRAALSEW